MDIKCATCQEPWEDYHMIHDEPWEVWDGVEGSSSHLLVKKFLESDRSTIPKMLRDDLAEKGWKFGRSIVTILRCPCCGDAGDVGGDVELRKGLRLAAEDLMGDDVDGLISTLEDIDRFAE